MSQQYKNTTLYFSRDDASIAMVLPAMDKLDCGLQVTETREDYHPAIKAALALARKK